MNTLLALTDGSYINIEHITSLNPIVHDDQEQGVAIYLVNGTKVIENMYTADDLANALFDCGFELKRLKDK